ncbi:LacI family DNA-binding transcriptional regulator [Paenibacillus kribbensis]|uniref:LacI family DNA-binding transcriptional regulator n=1 Tax=Paenibacillus kribbensis TaxID=172713 RepID=UPI0015BF4C8D|nr:LacI family DNA-binding transcriptional regulator [Paenibacillus kribbensis]
MSTKKSRVTIKEVAKAANVSTATVSRILNNRDGEIKISEETKKLVNEKAKELGFRLNPFASALRSRRSGLIGAVIRDIGDPFLAKLIKKVQKAANEQGLELLVGDSGYEEQAAEHQVSLMISQMFDGVLIFTHTGKEFIEKLGRDSVPYVSITGDYYNLENPRVHTNDIQGVNMAIHHLVELGQM